MQFGFGKTIDFPNMYVERAKTNWKNSLLWGAALFTDKKTQKTNSLCFLVGGGGTTYFFLQRMYMFIQAKKNNAKWNLIYSDRSQI